MKHLDQLAALLICLLETLKMSALAMQVTQPRSILVDSRNVTLECAYNITGNRTAQVLRISIFKGDLQSHKEVCAASFNSTTNYFERTAALHCQGRPRNGSVLITFIGLNTSHSDLYTCKMEKMHPPPYIDDKGNGTWIFIREDRAEVKLCRQFTQGTLVILVLAAVFMLYSVVITCLHWPLGSTACILRMKEAVDMKCELIHNCDEPATATWTGQRWETGPRQDVQKEPRRTEQ
ncbi:T-cell-specific surface glycoprotein CD28-like isoform X2 [Heterodontus francisci]|uniref:T-cell-specific surface glycoprotein CD28-like isoform X2 n=1 Tax=Heterodontus francisci TaxID=7792 RepID=UPI00355C9198